MDSNSSTNPGQANLSNINSQAQLNTPSETEVFSPQSAQPNNVSNISPTKQDPVTFHGASENSSDTTHKTMDTSHISPIKGVITSHANAQQKELVTQPSNQPVYQSRPPQTLNSQLPENDSLQDKPEQSQILPQQHQIPQQLSSLPNSNVQSSSLPHQPYQTQSDLLHSTTLSPQKIPSSQITPLKKEPQEQKISPEKSVAPLAGQTVILKSAPVPQNSNIVLAPINSSKMTVSQLDSNNPPTKSEPNTTELNQDTKPLLTTETDKKQMSYILQFLKEKGLSGTLNSLQKEANVNPGRFNYTKFIITFYFLEALIDLNKLSNFIFLSYGFQTKFFITFKTS